MLFVILWSVPSSLEDPQQTTTTGEHPLTIRFAPTSPSLPSNDLVANSGLSHHKRKTPRVSLCSLLLLLLTTAGDVELNPGPATYPCTQCSKEVQDQDEAILCDKCERWSHATCCGLDTNEYQVHLQALGDRQEWLRTSCTDDQMTIETHSRDIKNHHNSIDSINTSCLSHTSSRRVQ